MLIALVLTKVVELVCSCSCSSGNCISSSSGTSVHLFERLFTCMFLYQISLQFNNLFASSSSYFIFCSYSAAAVLHSKFCCLLSIVHLFLLTFYPTTKQRHARSFSFSLLSTTIANTTITTITIPLLPLPPPPLILQYFCSTISLLSFPPFSHVFTFT